MAVRGLIAAAILGAVVLLSGPAAAQQGPASSPILTLDQERLFTASDFGRRARASLEAAAADLAAENREIEADLTEEERELTEKRPGMTPEAFRLLADAFDQKVVEIRVQQDGKARDLEAVTEAERKRFFEASLPILLEIVREAGAVAILENRAIILAADTIDITDIAIARVNARLGDGSDGADGDNAAPEGDTPAPE